MDQDRDQPDGASSPRPAEVPQDDLIARLLEGKDDLEAAPEAPEKLFESLPEPASEAPSGASDRDVRGRLPEWFLPPAGPGDKWAHRRGEPRTFAFLWTLYLLMATVTMFWKVLRTGVPTLDIYRPSVRLLLVAAAVGATMIWPMVRMCQESPGKRRAAHVLADVMVLLLPLQAVLWPQMLLAQWSFAVVLAANLLLCAWVVALAPVVLRGWDLRGGWRAIPVGTCVVLIAAGPLIGMTARALTGAGTGLGHWALSSPLTGIYQITSVELGASRRGEVAGWQWSAIGMTWVFAGLSWVWAALRGWGGAAPEETGGLAPEPTPA